MDKGTILYHSAFRFKDGETGRKLLIILNTPQNDVPYLCCKTTSQPKWGLEREGCYNNKNIYVLNPIQNCFSLKTRVQFHELYEFDSRAFLQAHFNGDLEIVGNLPSQIINAIVNCIKKSEDISKYHLMLLK